MCTLTAALTGLAGYGQYRAQNQAYEAQARAYEAQAEAARQNQKIAEVQRSQVADNYAQQQKKLDDRRRLVIGQQTAEAGASGLMSTGSVMDTNASTQQAYKQDSINLLSNQRNDAMSAWISQVNYINQENQAKAAASNTRRQAKQAGLGTIINTALGMWGAGSKAAGVNTNTTKALSGNTNMKYWNKFLNHYQY